MRTILAFKKTKNPRCTICRKIVFKKEQEGVEREKEKYIVKDRNIRISWFCMKDFLEAVKRFPTLIIKRDIKRSKNDAKI